MAMALGEGQTRDGADDTAARASGRKSIVRQLWRSFALLLTVLIVSGVVSAYLLLEIVGIVRHIIEVEDPLERASLEMEINAGEANQALFNFITHPSPRHRDRFRDSNEDYLRFAGVFESLTAGDVEGAFGPLLIEIQGTYAELGRRIMTDVEAREEALVTLRQRGRKIDDLIDERMQRGLDSLAPGYTEKLNAALDIEINIDEAFIAIESYARRVNPDLRTDLEDAIADFWRFEALFRENQPTASEQAVLDQVASEFVSTMSIAEQVIDMSDVLEASVTSFRDELARFDNLIDERVQQTIRTRKDAAHWHTERASLLALGITVTMAIFVLAIAGLTTWVTTKTIVQSFWVLVGGLDAFAKGDLDHRILLGTDDELGRLGEAFNQMVEQRRQAVNALDEKNRVLAELSTKLSKYLSPQVYESIFRGEQDVVISTTRKKLTVFFSDIKDFTATTDNLEPEELASLLNEYLTEMSSIALAHGATIDKYVGDAMLLFFGDPATRGVREDALACVSMAIEMQRRMVGLRARWRDLGRERPLHMRIGINTGFCNVGNFGSDDRMDYTIIGGEVNLAARLESATPVDGITLAYETYSLVKHEVDAEEQEEIRVKGFDRSIRTFLVRGTLADEPAVGPTIHRDGEAMQVHIDFRQLDRDQRIEAAAELEGYARRLRDSSTDQG